MAETYTFEDRTYIEPTVSRDEQLGFIDRLREIENKDLQKIATDTHNLGSDLPSNLGGLSGINPDAGSAGIWRNRYERPQTNALVAGLRSSAQASALNDVLNNAMKQYKHRYNEAYRAAQNAKNPSSTEAPYDTVVGEDYEEAIKNGKLEEGQKSNSYYLYDSDKNQKDTINIITDSDGNIVGVNTPIQSYQGDDAKDYIRSLINQGYAFQTKDNQNVFINPGY
jgi:hypothetical protein